MYGMLTPGGCFQPASGTRRMYECMECLFLEDVFSQHLEQGGCMYEVLTPEGCI